METMKRCGRRAFIAMAVSGMAGFVLARVAGSRPAAVRGEEKALKEARFYARRSPAG